MTQKISVILPFSGSFLDYPDNESPAVVAYVCGCEQTCPECHNPALKHRESGTEMKEAEFEFRIYSELYRCKTNKLVISGGDPLHPGNINVIKNFLLKNQHKIDICIYTGYNIEYVKRHSITGYKFIKCGTYDEKLKQLSEKTDKRMVLSSANQKLYNSDAHQISKQGIFYFGDISWIEKLKVYVNRLIHK
jgi:organic radical activating enzyme